jgi:hypothetical protein
MIIMPDDLLWQGRSHHTRIRLYVSGVDKEDGADDSTMLDIRLEGIPSPLGKISAEGGVDLGPADLRGLCEAIRKRLDSISPEGS